VGFAVFPQDGESYETLLATADSRMYQDKVTRKRRASSRASHATDKPLFALAEVSDVEIQRAAAGVL
jgi:predicted signal transduction protein with EAL and GGDEF domain